VLKRFKEQGNTTRRSCCVHTPAQCSNTSAAKVGAVNEHGQKWFHDQALRDECPRHELFYLRTDACMQQPAISVRLLVDLNAPHEVLFQESSPWVSWKSREGSDAAAASAITLPDLVRSRRDKEAMTRALAMLLECQAGVLTLAVRNGNGAHNPQISLDPFLFLVLQTTAKTCICVDATASAACCKRLHPTLHLEWWNQLRELGDINGAARFKCGPIFEGGYESDTADEEEHGDADTLVQGRHVFEIAATSRFLVRDLARRVKGACSAPSTGTSPDMATANAAAAQSPRSPKSLRSPPSPNSPPKSPKKVLRDAYKGAKKDMSGFLRRLAPEAPDKD